jgi:release factor glutamine methyltransferase
MTSDPIYRTLAAARARLEAAGISPREAAVDVDLFARAALGWDRARLLSEQREATPDGLEPAFSTWLTRRERREPSAYIIGSREFWGLDFRVTPDVLIPRPETEFIVEETLALIAVGHPSARIAEIGTGCGAIAVSLATELPGTLIATDVSGAALAVAHDNAVAAGVDSRITFIETSYLDGITGPFDIVVSNPPYVKAGDKPALSAEVKYEPDVALFGGASGMVHVEAVLDTALRVIPSGGWLVMEFGFGQDETVEGLIASRSGLRLERIRADLQGIPRTAVVQRR